MADGSGEPGGRGFLLRKRDVEPAMSRVFDRFPILQQRRKTMAGSLSGGERKMLALGRGRVVTSGSGPDLLSSDGLVATLLGQRAAPSHSGESGSSQLTL